VIIIGSGATAVTLAPSLAEGGAKVVMVQRSPTYMISQPAEDRFANWLRRTLPKRLAYDLIRLMRISLQQLFFRLARARPKRVRERLLALIRERVGPDYDMAHFTPRYDPWTQRLCLAPDNDLFDAVRAGQVTLVTGAIDSFTETGVKLASGRALEADIIVAATGLELQMFGGAEMVVDGAQIQSGQLYSYKGAMFSDVPNLASVFGYTNASWTLRADLICEYVCRLLNHLDRHGFASATPRLKGPHEDRPFVDFSSGYFQRAQHLLPKQTTRAPWIQSQSYVRDILDLRFGRIADDALEFAPAPEAPAQEALALEAAAR
jgi:cation diffusion facilitator CzcD-associated flavoprotein CzcO